MGGAVLFVLLFATIVCGIPLTEYHRRIQQSVNALDTLTQTEEEESESQRAGRISSTISEIRLAVPRSAKVDWDGTSFNVDNGWLDEELKRYEGMQAEDSGRSDLLDGIIERLQAIDERLTEIDNQKTAAAANKAETRARLNEILHRPEYSRTVVQESALSRLWRRFMHWLKNLFPEAKPLQPGRATAVSRFAQVFVVLLALAVIVYAVRAFAPRFVRRRRTGKKAKAEARVVLGERLEQDQSSSDLLAEAEALARDGNLRAAIRKAYIALLVELGDRKVISLAQYKTNRDYLRDVHEIELLHRNLKTLTQSFERHWYGFAQTNENDWLAFRSGYTEALSSS